MADAFVWPAPRVNRGLARVALHRSRDHRWAVVYQYPVDRVYSFATVYFVVVAAPAALAAWALWVILSAGRRPATESAGY